LGGALDDIAKAHKKVNWHVMDLGINMPMGSAATRDALDKCKDDAVAEFKKTVNGELRNKIQDARKAAQDTAAKFEKNKKTPKKSTEAAKAVAKAADHFMVACNQNTIGGQIMQDYKDNLKGIATREKVMGDNTKRLKGYLASVARGIKTIKTKSEFQDFWSEDIRGVGTALPLVSKDLGILAEHKQWRVFASQDFIPETDEDVEAQLKKVVPTLKKIAAAVK